MTRAPAPPSDDETAAPDRAPPPRTAAESAPAEAAPAPAASSTSPAAPPTSPAAPPTSPAASQPSPTASPTNPAAPHPVGATSSAAPATTDATARAGRGGLAVAAAKAWFIVLGLVQQIALKHVLGLDGYGALSTVISAAGVAYNPVVSTSVQAVSRSVASSAPEHQDAAARRAVAFHFATTLPLAGAFWLAAPLITASMAAPHLLGPMRVAAGVIVAYGLYAPLIGVLNGRQRFVAQAAFDASAAALRTVGLLVGAYVGVRWASGAGPTAAMVGFAVSSAAVLTAALALVPVGRPGTGGRTLREHVAYVAPLLLGQALLNLLLQADSLLLRAFASRAALAEGLPATAADPIVGAYRAAQLFGFLPYQLLISVTFVLLPLLSAAQRDGDAAGVARTTLGAARIAAVVAGVFVTVSVGLSDSLVRLVFGADTAALGGRALRLLAPGLGAFAVLGVLMSVLNGLGRARHAAALTAAAVLLVAGTASALASGRPLEGALLERVALGTSAGMIAVTLGAALLVRRVARATLPVASAARVVAAAAAAAVVAQGLPALLGWTGPWPGGRVGLAAGTLAASGGLAVLYAALLWVTGELRAAEGRAVLRLLGKRG